MRDVNDDDVIIVLRGEGKHTLSAQHHLDGAASRHHSTPLAHLVGRAKQQAPHYVGDATAAGIVGQGAKQAVPASQWRCRHWSLQPRAAASPASP